jgi:hypothetical protein
VDRFASATQQNRCHRSLPGFCKETSEPGDAVRQAIKHSGNLAAAFIQSRFSMTYSGILISRGLMNTIDIIIQIDAEISRLQEAKALLAGTAIAIKRKPGRPSVVNSSGKTTSSIPAKSTAKPAAKRTVSTEARKKMAAAQKARWAKTKKAAKKEARAVATTPTVKSTASNGIVPKPAPAKKTVSAKKAAQPKTKIPVSPAA